ncbi:MAG: hypothetical protein CVU54_01860 [Deltaproteobacteria bacterium HGW-Deltaproteobacteria-12]|jgi:hypothetical protein|nr:MAG: hypothetical protein CVU54_01860 [Deltaproteobacteria bacterium HGW-Deltaproteobacteria-12]
MSTDLITLKITADSSGAVAGVANASKSLDDFADKGRKAETSTRNVKSATDSANASFMQMASAVRAIAAAYGVLKLAEYVKDVTLLAARYETLGVVMRVVGNNAGYTGAQMAAYAQSLEKAGISMTEARQTLTRMVQANLDLAQSTKLARVAQDAAVIGNINSSEAFQRMVYGIQSGQVEILRTIGINVNFENSYQNVAKATGRAATSFSEAEKSQIRMNTVMEAGKMIAGTYEAAMGTAGKQVLSLQRHIDNLKVGIGLAFTPALAEIIEQITGAITDLNGNLTGEGKQAIADWGTNFRITIIDIETHIYKLAMSLDKIGGTATSAKMFFWGPTAALGFKDSVRGFEAAAKANIEYENRYNASAQAIEDLNKKRLELEKSLTAEGKVAAKAAQDAAENKRLAARKAAEETAIETTEAKKLREQWEKAKEALNFTITTAGMDDLDRALAKLEKDMAKLRENPNADLQLINEARLAEQTKLVEQWYANYLKDNAAASEKMKAQEKATQDSITKGLQETIDFNKKMMGERIAYYESIQGYEETAYNLKLARIEKERQAYIQLYGDIGAANAKANQDQITALSARIDAEQKGVRSAISGFDSMLDAAMKCYSEESSEYKRLQDFKKVALAAELAMNIAKNIQIVLGYATQATAATAAAGITNTANASTAVTGAVSSVASQGTGDPYTAFPRIAAMIAIMTGVLGIAGIAFGAGSSVSSAAVPALPKSTVLGAADGTGSESIENSFKLLSDTYQMEETKLTKIYNELKDLNSNITGLVSSVLRTGGISGMNITTMSSLGNVELAINKLSQSGLLSLFMGGTNVEGNEFFSSVNKIRAIGLDFGSLAVEKYMPQLLSWVANGIFGGSSEQTLVHQGIGINSPSIRNLIGGQGVSGYNYAGIVTHTDGGWFSSDSDTYSKAYGALDSTVTTLFTSVFKNLGATLYELSKGLGADVNTALNYSFGNVEIDLKDKTGEEINKTITELISNISDNAAMAILGPIISQYQQINEGLYETAVRLLTDKEAIAYYLKMTNQAFSGTIPAAIQFSETLITIAGSLDKLTESMQTYYDAFFSDAEKQVKLKDQLTEILGTLGFDLPGQRAGYRSLVESLDLTSTAGQTAYVALMNMSKSADDYYKYLENAKGKLKPENYATAADYQRAMAGYADGGISSGPETGYYAQLHGTELIVSPRKGYSATVIGADSPELLAEIKALRHAVESGNSINSSNTVKITRLLDRWDGDGIPAERVI